MPKKYETSRQKSPHYARRRRLFKSLEGKEQYYKHSIPPKSIGRTLRKLDLRASYRGLTPRGDIYSIKNGGIEHGRMRVGRRTKKVDWWYIK